MRIARANPGYLERVAHALPDGDSELDDVAIQGFTPPECTVCGGSLRPDVVFFGENVARPIVEAAYAIVDAADVLLIVGSSLAVFSGYRFVRRAAERGIPVAIVNHGPTRGDPYATLLLDERAGAALPALAAALT